MSLDLEADQSPLTRPEDLVRYFSEGERPRTEHQVGLEHEKFIYPRGGAKALAYIGPQGIGALLSTMDSVGRGYHAHKETPEGPTIALIQDRATVSLEPGGQFELSGTPFRTAREAHQENLAHLEDLRRAGDLLGVYPIALGYRPFDVRDQMPWMPKMRYGSMRQSLPERGSLALNMMLMTATGQVSLDWADEADCARKVTASARLAPLLVALYANSPLAEGKPSGLLSFRSHVWTDVDYTRCGFIPSMLDGTFSYRAYTEWALDAPLLFLRRHGRYLRPPITFRQLMAEGFEGQPPTRGDWVDHLSTLFPEVRIKKVLEVRSADSVNPQLTGALAALWRGLLYDEAALTDALTLLPSMTFGEHAELMALARREGLRGKWKNVHVGEASKQMVALAREGLQRLDPEDVPLLEPLEALAASGRTCAEDVLEAWEKDPDPVRLLERSAV